MNYHQIIFLKNGASCILRTATAQDAPGVLHCFLQTHAETDNLLTYPDENTMSEAQEAAFLQEKADSADSVELCAAASSSPA